MTMQQVVAKTAGDGTLSGDEIDALEMLMEMEGKTEVVRGGEAPMVKTRSIAPKYMLRRATDGKLKEFRRHTILQKLQERLPDGSRAWFRPNAPFTPTFVGTKKCKLHPEHPDYAAKYRQMGLSPCSSKKANMANDETVELHMLRKHAIAHKAIAEAEKRAREDARDAAQNRMAEAVTLAMQARVAAPMAAAASQLHTVECPTCHEAFDSTRKAAAQNKMKAHMRTAHAEKAG